MAPAAIILTGGQSRRMGTDKAALVVDGVAMVERVRLALQQAGVDRIVIAGSRELPDPEASAPGFVPQGPMAGITSGWNDLCRTPATAKADPVVVLSCDLPALSTDVVAQLMTASVEHAHGALAHDGERPQPLIAAYRPAALDAMAQAYRQGQRSVRKCFEGWDLGIVRFDQAVLADADTPNDLDGFHVQWPSQ